MRFFCNVLADKKQERATGTLELKAKQSDSDSHGDDDDCDEPEIVKLMMHYFYHFDYLEGSTATSHEIAGGEIWDTNSWELPPAKRDSKKAAKSKRTLLHDSAKIHLIEHAKLFAMAVKYQVVALQRLAAGKFKAEAYRHWDHEDFPKAVHLVYTTTPDEVSQLREAAVDVLHTYYDYFVGRPDVQSLLRSINGLACDLLNRDHQNEYVICLDRRAHCSSLRSADTTCGGCGTFIKVCNDCAWEPNTFLCENCA